ncbi:MAG: hypothetical protein JSV25_02385, partial [Spirochaetota bacterium]
MSNALMWDITNYGVRIKKLVSSIKTDALLKALFSDTVKSYDYIDDLLQFYLDETQGMVFREYINSRDWMVELKKDGFIHTALFEADEIRYSVGNASSTGMGKDLSFYIGEDGEVHYIYYKKDDSTFLDLSLTLSGFGSYVSTLRRSPGSLVLYDSNNNQYSVLNGNLSDIPKGVVTNSKDFPESRITLTIKGLVVMKQM